MNLKKLTRQLIYNKKNTDTPEIYQKFGIVCPEYSVHEVEVKEYPMSDEELLFALLWDIPDSSHLSATIVPCRTPFTYSCTFNPGRKFLAANLHFTKENYVLSTKTASTRKFLTARAPQFCFWE